MSSRRSRGEASAWAVICVMSLVVGATSCGQVEEQKMNENTVDQTTSNSQTENQVVSSGQAGSSQTVSNDPTTLADSTESGHSANSGTGNTGTGGAKYGEAISYGCSFGGQILTEHDLIRIGISGATDTPKTQATLAVYFRDQSEFDTIQTVDLNVPVDIGGFSIELTAVNMKGRWVAVDIREPLETTE